ncbi:MAG: glycosyltransferase family 4 protein [Phycisphaerae bacterium]
MTRGLDEIGVKVSFVLPQSIPADAASHVSLRTPDQLLGPALSAPAAETQAQPQPQPAPAGGEQTNIEQLRRQTYQHLKFHPIPISLQPYASPGQEDDKTREMIEQAIAAGARSIEQIMQRINKTIIEQLEPTFFVGDQPGQYRGNLMDQVHRYTRLAIELARREDFDVVHAHDWMTFPAGQAVAAVTGKPLVVHIHSTEFDRSGENVNQRVYDIERAGMHAASRVICVSHLTRNIVRARYGIGEHKIDVIYNAVDADNGSAAMEPIRTNEKIVLFLGRVTMQKGPEYFLMAAKKVIQKFPNVRFVMAGSGDMITQCIRLCADLKLGKHVAFTGFLRSPDVKKVFSMADLYVMPSVSEPFGIAPLEALSHNVPVIISKQSGVSEVLTHVLKVDFWDIDEMANKILAVLRHPPLQRTLRQHGQIELRKFSWTDSARKIQQTYQSVVEAQVS